MGVDREPVPVEKQLSVPPGAEAEAIPYSVEAARESTIALPEFATFFTIPDG